MSTSPNVLVIMADQLAPHFTGTYGHPVVKTPNLDRLAERGMRFDAAYCSSPLCAPSRFALMSGQAATRIGAWDNAAELPASVPTLAHYLTRMGYVSCLSGKMHFVGPDQLHGFTSRLTTDIYPADFAWTPDWDRPDERIAKWYHGMDSVKEAGQASITYQLEYDEEVGFAANRRLFDLARRRNDGPWLLVASFIHPHDPYVARPEWWDLYNHDDIDPPGPVDVERLDPHARRIRAGIEADSVAVTDEQVRNARHGYYANTSYFDGWVGTLLDTLAETGLADTTIVVVTADHGDMLGERGNWFKMSFYERSVRVPLVVAGPGVAKGSAPHPVSLVDLLPTLLDIAADAGRELPALGTPIDGRSLWHVASGGVDDGAEIFAEYTAEMTSHPMFMLRRGAFKYIHCDTDPPLLYDVVADPEELDNLAAAPDHSALAADLGAAVAKRWDSEAIRDQVVASQRARRAVHAAMSAAPTSWDHHPVRDSANEYVRNHMDWEIVGPQSRFPPRQD